MNHQKAKKGKLCIVRISSPLLQTESYIEVDGVTCRQFTRVNCHVYVDEMVMITGRVEKQSFKVLKWKMKELQPLSGNQ